AFSAWNGRWKAGRNTASPPTGSAGSRWVGWKPRPASGWRGPRSYAAGLEPEGAGGGPLRQPLQALLRRQGGLVLRRQPAPVTMLVQRPESFVEIQVAGTGLAPARRIGKLHMADPPGQQRDRLGNRFAHARQMVKVQLGGEIRVVNPLEHGRQLFAAADQQAGHVVAVDCVADQAD